MRRPPFQVNPLALSVALLLAAPVAAVAQDTPLTTNSSAVITNPVVVISGSGSITTNNIGNVTELSGVVSGTGQLVKQGDGTLSLTNNNTYQSTVIEQGTLSIKRASSLGDGDVTITEGSTLATQTSTTITNKINLTPETPVDNPLTTAATISTVGKENITQVTSSIAGSSGLIKSGDGTLSLTADNAYAGNTTIQQGTLAISREGSLGAGTAVSISNGAVLQTNKDVTISKSVILDSQSTIDTHGSNSKVTGNISGSGVLIKSGDGSLTLDTKVTAPDGTVSFRGNDYSGGTAITGGLLIVNDDKDLGKANTNVAITGGTLQIANDITLKRNIVTGSFAGGSISTAGHNVVLEGAVLNNGRGHLVKSGAGKLTLTSDLSNYNIGTVLNTEGKEVAVTGNTVINGGTLSVAKDEFLGIQEKLFEVDESGIATTVRTTEAKDWDRGNLLIDGGTLETTAGLTTQRTVNIGAAGATINVVGGANNTTLEGLVKGTGGLIKEGDGTLHVSLQSGNYTTDGIALDSNYSKNTYVGKTVVKAGVLEINTVERDLGASVEGVELAGGNLKINGTSALTKLSLTATGGAIDTTGSAVTVANITGASTAELKKKGSGTLVLNGTNTYAGDTTISEGKVQIKDEKSLGANAAKLILDGGVLQVTAATNLVKDTTITTNNGTIDTTSQNVVLEGKVSGVGQLIKSGAGTLTLKSSANSGDNTFEGGVRIKEGALEVSTDSALGKDGGSVVIDGATLAITGTGDNTLKRSITLTEKGGTVSVAAGGKATLTGELQLDKDAISADLTKAGAGELALTKDNTTGKFKGNTIIKEGTLGVTSENNLAQGKLFLDGGNLRTNADITTFSKDIILNSQGGVDTNGHDSRVQSTIQGDGTFVKSGEGELTLEGGNTYAGGTLIEGVGTVAAGHKASVLAVTNHANLGLNNTNITLDQEGELKLLANLDIGAADGRALIVGSGNGSLNTNGHDSTISSAIAGTGKLTKKGEGKLTLTANNSLTGGVVNNTQTGGITVEQGTLSISNDNNLGSVSAVLTLKTDATAATATTFEVTNNVRLNRQVVLAGGDITLAQGANTVTAGQAISGSGSITKTGTGDLTLDAANTYTGGTHINQGSVTLSKAVSSLGSGVVTLANDTTLKTLANVSIANKTELGGAVTVNTADQTSATFVSTAVISDASNSTGVLKKDGKGTLILDSANTYSGGTQINDGRVAISQNAALSTGVVSLAATATLDATSNVTLANQMTLASGAALETSANLTLANQVTLSGNGNATFNAKQNTNTIVLESKVTGTAGVTKEGDGSLILKSANDYAGSTIVNKGTVVVASQGALSTGAVTLNAGTTLETANQVNLANAINLAGVKTDKVNLSVATNNNSTISGVISGTASLVKKGGGVLTLTGDSVTGVNTYTGDTIIEAGALAITSGANLGANGTNVTLQGGDLQLLKDDIQINGGSITTVANSSGGINTNGHNSTMNSTVKGDGTFVKKGDGTLTLEADNSALIGGVRVEKGTLAISQDASLGKSDAKLTLAGGILSVTKDVTLTREVSINTAASTIQTNANVTLAGLVSGDAQLVLEGGTFKLTHDNSYAGGTKVLNSTLTINNTKNLGAETGVLTLDNGTLQTTGDLVTSRQVTLNSALNILDSDTHAVTLAGEVSGSGSLVKNGSGDLTLSHQNTYTGDTTINGGKVTLDGNNASFGNGTVTFANATTLATSSNVTVANAVQLDGQTTLNTATANSSLAISQSITGNTGSLIKTGGGVLTLAGQNSYTGGTTVTQGTVVIGQQSSLGSGAVTLQAGTTLETAANLDNTLQLTGDNNSSTATDAVSLVVAQSQSSTLSRVVTGDAGLIKSGAGTLKLDAANTYAGGTTVSAGTVILGSQASLGSGAVTLKAGTTLDTAASFANSIHLLGDQSAVTKTDLVRLNVAQANSTLSGNVTGDSGLVKEGIGQLTLTGDNKNYTGDIHVNAGKVAINNSHALGMGNTVSFTVDTTLETTSSVTLENNILLTGNATLDSKTHDSTLKTGAISGTGSLTKQGTGKLTLEGNNAAYTGNMTIESGMLAINNSQALGDNNTVTLATGTTLETSQVVAVSLANTTIHLSGNATLNNANTSSLTIANAITGTSNSGLTKVGTGTLTLNGVNSYTGNTSITAGKVVLGTNAATLGASTAVVTLADATTLETSANAIVANAVTLSSGQATLSTVSANSSLTMSNTVNGSGGLVKAGAGTLTLNAANNYTGNTAITGGKVVLGSNAATLGASTAAVTLADATTLETSANTIVSNAVVLSGGQTTVNTASTGSSLTINQAITGAGGLIKAGAGTLTLAGANTYTGDTSISGGKVVLSTDAASLGAANTGIVTLANATTLETSANATVANSVQLNGQTTINTALINSSLTIANSIVGTGGMIKIGEGNLVLREANDYTGNTQINKGKIIVGHSQSLGSGSASFDGGTALVTSSAVTLANNIQLGGSVTVDAGVNASTLSGVVSGTGSLTKIGEGSLTLSRANTYTGDTLINVGKVIVSDNAALGVNNNAVFSAGTKLETSSAVTLANQIQLKDGNMTISNTNATDPVTGLMKGISLDGVVSGAGMLTKTGTGDLTLSKANTYKGGTTINQGTVIVGNAASFGDAVGLVTLNSDTTLKSSIDVAIANNLVFTGNGQKILNSVDASTLEIVNAMTGTGGFIKVGTGTLKLDATNTYVGDTVINQGTVIVGQQASLGSGAVTLQAGTTLETAANLDNILQLTGDNNSSTATDTVNLVVAQGQSSTLSQVVKGDAGLIKSGTGTLTLHAANTYSGGTTVNAGKVIVDHATALGSGQVVFKSGTELTTASAMSVENTLRLDGNMTLHSLANSTFTGNVSGTGNLTKDGVGTLRLEHANTGYTGSITISEGGLVVNNNSALGAGQLTLATGTALETANAVTLANRIQLAGDTTLNSVTHDSVLAGQITGVGKLIKEGDGSFTLSESNSYAGGTLIKAGTIVVKNDKSLGAKQAEFSANTTLKIDAASAISLANDIKLTDSVTVNSATNGVLSGVVSGAGSLTKVGVGSLTLNGVNTYTGATTINAGSVAINTAKSLGAGSQLAINNAALETAANIKLAQAVSLEGNATFNTTAKDKTLEMTNVISGGGSLTKEGDGVLTLSQANTYKGNTAVNKGTVVVGNSTSFGLGTVTFAGATALEASTNISLANAIKFNGQTTLNSKLANMTLEVSNAITGDGSLVKSGDGHLKLNAANSYTGSTTINAGKVILGSSTASFGTGMVALANQTALETSANVTLANAVQLNGQATVNTTLNASALAFSNTITGTGSLIKTGLGTLSLNGENTYKGGTTITEGNVIVSNNAALGEGSVIFSNNTGLETSTAVSLANAMRLDGKTTINTQTHNSRLMGVMSGAGDLTKIGTGSLALEANNSNYIGGININAGKLVINDSKALGSGAMTFATGTELATSKSIVVNNQMTLAGNVTVTNADALEIKSIKGAGSLTKSGSGDLTLNASNAHTGGTIINAGKLIVGNSAALGSGKASFADSTTLEASGIITLANKIDLVGSMTLNSDYEGSELNGVVLNGVMSGGKAGKLIKVGKGNLTLGGENTYSGGTVINTGKVIIGQNAALGTGSVTFGNNTMLEVIADASTVVTLDNIFTLNGSTTLINATNNTELKSVINGNGSLIKQGKGVLSLTAANTYAGGTTIQSGLVAIKQDDNLGTGLLTLNGGGLQFATASAPTFAHNVVVGVASGSIDTQANNITASGNISGSGKLTKLGAGLLTLSGDNTAYTGSLSIEAGTLGVAEQKNLGTSELTIKNAAIKTNANLVNAIKLAGNAVFDTSSSIIASGVIGGSGSLIKTGEGNLELSGVNDYSGNTILKEGILTLSKGANLGLSNLQVQGGKLSLKDGFVSQGELIQDTKDAIVIAAGSNNTFSKTTVNSGALVVDGTLTSPITISVGGSLRGSGKVVGNTVVEGTLSPGNSPGIFAVKGNLTHKPTTTLEIEIDGAGAGTGAGKHDQVLVDGNFTADGSLVAKLRNITGTATNQFVPSVGQSFEVVKANAVNGVFASYTAPTEGLATGTRLDVGYTPTSVRLYVTPESYSAVVSGENRVGVSRFLDAAINIERSSAEGLKRLAEGTTDLAKLYQALIPANTQMINDALVSMSPAIYAESAQSVLAIQQNLHNTQTLSESFKKGGVAVKLLQQDTDVDSDGNGIAATRSISGVQLAVDSEPYNNGWQMGATVSVINKGDIAGQGAALDLTGQDISLALRKQTKNWLLVGELDIGSYQLDAKRNVILGSSTFANAQDGINAKTYGFGLSASRAISEDWQVLTGVRYNNVNQSSFAEVGNSLLRLTVDKVQQNQVVAMMGANWSQSFAAANWKVMPKLGLQLEQTLMGDTAQAEATLSTQRLSSQASDTGKSLFRAMVGVSATHQSGLTVGVDAASEQGSNASGTTGRLSLSKSF